MAETKGSSVFSCTDRCGCPVPCPGGTACRCRTVSETASGGGGGSSGGNEHNRCSCGEHCGCNPCTCPKGRETTGAGKVNCKCGAGCTCVTCTT